MSQPLPLQNYKEFVIGRENNTTRQVESSALKRFQRAGVDYFAAPARPDWLRWLRATGYHGGHTTAFTCEYPGIYTPFDHQRISVETLVTNPRCFDLSEMGTGKTASSIWAAEYLMNVGEVRKVLVLSTKTTVKAVWFDELFKLVPHRSRSLVMGSTKKKRDQLNHGTEWTVANHALVKTKGFEEYMAANAGQYDLVIVDEASAFRDAATAQHKALMKLTRPVDLPRPRLWLLTGTPTPQGPTDAFGLGKLASESPALPASFYRWRDMTMLKVGPYKWVPQHDAWEKVHQVLQPAIRHKFADCVSIPETFYINRYAPLTKEQQDMVEAIRRDMQVRLESGEHITAANAGVVLLKILQIMQGAVKIDEDTVQEVDNGPRMELLLQTIAETERKFLILAPFTASLHKIRDTLEANDIEVAFVDGSVTGAQRAKRFDHAKHGSARGLLAQSATVAHGLSFIEADTTIWFGPTSTEAYLQANRRTTRPGQKHKTRIIKLYSTDFEKAVYDRAESNAANQESLLDMYRNFAAGNI